MEHVSERPVSKETHEYVRWLMTFMWNSLKDTHTKEMIKREIERVNRLYGMSS
jgi:hypothetical protein